MHNDIIKNFSFSFRLVYACSRALTLSKVALSLILSVLPLAGVYMIKLLIDNVTRAVESGVYEVQPLMILVILMGGIFLMQNVAESLQTFVRQVHEQRFFDHVYTQLHRKTVSLEMAYFEDEKYHNLFSRAVQNADRRPLSIVDHGLSFFQHVMSIASLGILLITLHWSIPFLLLLVSLPLGFVKVNFARRLYRWNKTCTQDDRKVWDINDVLTNPYYAKEIRLFGTSGFFTTTFAHLRSKIREGYLQIFRQRVWVESVFQLLAAFAVFGALGYICLQTVEGIITVGGLAMYVMAIQKGVSLFQQALSNIALVYEDGLYIKYIKDFLALKPKENEGRGNAGFPEKLTRGISFNNVSFAYPNSQRQALSNVSIEIPAGSTVAIVGVNGAGKSTLVKLLCGLYDVQKGDVLFDDVSIKSMNLDEVRKNISVLFQNFAKYHLTAEENIWLGNPLSPLDRKKVQEAAQSAQIDQVLSMLPKGYETLLGKIYASSEDLSVGEWQKLGLARAIFKDSQVIVLDEPSSAMDPEAEYALFSMFKKLTKGKTSIIITHRFSSVRLADYIYVMDKEHVVEHGTHKELLEREGRYASMFSKQAEGYLPATL